MAQRRTMQPDDLFALQFLNGGALSPDGERVVYTVSQINAEVDKEYAALHLLDLASGESRRLTHGEQSDRGARWSPDGQAIAFISDRSGTAQLHLMRVDGGEAWQLSDFARGVGGSFAWSPDGAQIAFSAKADAEAPDLSKEAYRVDRTVYRFDAIGYLDGEAQDIYALDVASGDVTRLTDDRSNNSNLRWAADGGSILYDANMHPDAARVMTPDLMRVDLAGNKATLLSGWASVAGASLTPDSQHVVFVGRPDDGKPIGTKADLYVLDIAAGTVECRTPSLDVGVGGGLSLDMPVGALGAENVVIADDGQSALANVQRGGTNHIYRIALSGAESWQPVTSGESAVFLLGLAGERLLYAQTSMNIPPELYLKRPDEDAAQRLTALNEARLAEIDLPAWSRLLWQSVDDTEVEGWYLKPPTGEAPYPTILYIHGGPHAAYGCGFHFDFQMLAGAGYGVLFLNHRASTGYGDAFSTAIKGDWGNLDYQDLLSGVDHAIALGLADADRLGVCGTSGGGNLSCWIIGQTDRFKAAIPQNPVTNWRSFYGTSDVGIYFAVEQMGGHPHEIPEVYARCSPITYAHRCTTPTLLVQSELDYRCPAEQSEQFYTVLKAAGCTVEMLRQPGGYHGASIRGAVNLRRAHNDAMLEWFARYV
ncbi:MAG: S9 family peptidase [Chloroflexi bacterium]|nr:S9 family peptidase [Chloroflexota bacterium]MCY4248630.1 S9 family peptidase [Chloroflexota bacterium]